MPDGVSHHGGGSSADCHQFIDHRQDMFFAVLVGELLGGREKRVPVVGRPCADRLGEQTPLEFGEVQVVVTGHSEIPSAFTIPLPRYGPTGPLSRPRAMYLSWVMEIRECPR